MSEKKYDPLLDKREKTEAALSAAHLVAEVADKAEEFDKKLAAKRQPASPPAGSKPPTKKPPTRVQRLDRALGRAATKTTKALVKGFNPLEKAASVYELGKLATSEDARQEARDSVEQMGRDPNVTALERFTQGFSDPFATMYGMKHWGRELGKAKKRARESGRELERARISFERGETPVTGGIIPDPKTRENARRKWAKYKEDSRRAALLQARRENRK
tara:strand:+ start:575 stop:1231 length:657 start_codon:yes stop_codon:yes gene_type:complete